VRREQVFLKSHPSHPGLHTESTPERVEEFTESRVPSNAEWPAVSGMDREEKNQDHATAAAPRRSANDIRTVVQRPRTSVSSGETVPVWTAAHVTALHEDISGFGRGGRDLRTIRTVTVERNDGMTARTESGLSEAASEKRKRGRPPVMADHDEALVSYCAPDVRTRRGKLDVFYRQRALGILAIRTKDKRFAWVADRAAIEAETKDAWKPGILSALGRIPNDEDLKAVALRVCELKPKTKDAIAMIRRWRTGKASAGDAVGLHKEIVRAVNDYLHRHPGTPWLEVEAALLATLDSARSKGA
jgi:hypothetical protein